MPAIRRVQRDRSSRPGALFALEAQQLLGRGAARQAVELCKRGLAYYPENPTGYIVLAQAYIMLDEKARALNVLQDGYRRTGSERLNELALEVAGEHEPSATADQPIPQEEQSATALQPPTFFEEIVVEEIAATTETAAAMPTIDEPLVQQQPVQQQPVQQQPVQQQPMTGDQSLQSPTADLPIEIPISWPEQLQASIDEATATHELPLVVEDEVAMMEMEIAEIEPGSSFIEPAFSVATQSHTALTETSDRAAEDAIMAFPSEAPPSDLAPHSDIAPLADREPEIRIEAFPTEIHREATSPVEKNMGLEGRLGTIIGIDHDAMTEPSEKPLIWPGWSGIQTGVAESPAPSPTEEEIPGSALYTEPIPATASSTEQAQPEQTQPEKKPATAVLLPPLEASPEKNTLVDTPIPGRDRRENIVPLGSPRQQPTSGAPQGGNGTEMDSQRRAPATMQGPAQERPRTLALHMGKHISRLRSSNLRLIPGLEFAPLRHEDQTRKQSIAPLINEPMPMPVAESSLRTQRQEEQEKKLPPLPPLGNEEAEKEQLQIGEREPEVIAPPELPQIDGVDLEEPEIPEAEIIPEEPEPFTGNILKMVQAAQKEVDLTPLEELARRLENARIPVVEEAENRPVFAPSIVSETLANILVAQGAYAEALKAFQTLARTKPDRVEYLQQRIIEMKWRIKNPGLPWPPEHHLQEDSEDTTE